MLWFVGVKVGIATHQLGHDVGEGKERVKYRAM